MLPLSFDLSPGFATPKTRPMNSMVVISNPFASSGEMLHSQDAFLVNFHFYWTSFWKFAEWMGYGEFEI